MRHERSFGSGLMGDVPYQCPFCWSRFASSISALARFRSPFPMKALARAVPEQVITPGFDTTTVGVLSHLGKEGWSVYLEIFGGGFGATAQSDGCDAVDGPLSNCSNTPVEALDHDFSFFRELEYSLRQDSCGAGASRGGLGFLRRFAITADGV